MDEDKENNKDGSVTTRRAMTGKVQDEDKKRTDDDCESHTELT